MIFGNMFDPNQSYFMNVQLKFMSDLGGVKLIEKLKTRDLRLKLLTKRYIGDFCLGYNKKAPCLGAFFKFF